MSKKKRKDIRDLIEVVETPSTEVEEITRTVGRLMELRDNLYQRALSGNMAAADEYRKLEAWLLELTEKGQLVESQPAPTSNVAGVAMKRPRWRWK